MRSQWTGLVGDVGGTNARLALTDGQGHIRNPRTFACKDYASLADIVAEYIETTAGRKRPPRAVLAVAGPVVDGEIEFTNLDWTVSEGDLLAHFEFEAVELINDFAAQALACQQELDLDPAKVNVNGGAIALGHPLGASGTRISATLIHEMKRREQVRYGLATMCVGVGQGVAVIYEKV